MADSYVVKLRSSVAHLHIPGDSFTRCYRDVNPSDRVLVEQPAGYEVCKVCLAQVDMAAKAKKAQRMTKTERR